MIDAFGMSSAVRQAIEQRIGPVTSSRVTRVLTLVVVGLVLASVAGQYFEYLVGFDGHAGTKTLIKLVDVDRERNIPTWYSSATLLLCAALLAKIALAKKRQGSRYVLHWAALSVIFLLIAFDETAVHHEAIGHRLRDAFQMKGLLYFSWVVPGAAIAAVLALAYLRFVAHLPSETRRLFLVAGTLYILGVLVVEAVGGRHMELYGMDLQYKMLTTIEEAFEMMGILVFIHALISYVSPSLMADGSVSAPSATPRGPVQEKSPVRPVI